MPEKESVTVLLQRMKNGDQAAREQLVHVVYSELRRIAAAFLRRERSGHTLEPTALVHEAYLRMADQSDFGSRAHFFSVASNVMRQILVDSARKRRAAKRTPPAGKPQGVLVGFDLVAAVDDALSVLEKQDALKARLIEMRFFGGLTAEESAEVLSLPVQTVRRQLRVGQAWLQRELSNTRQQDS